MSENNTPNNKPQYLYIIELDNLIKNNNIPTASVNFARSLVRNGDKYILSDKQMYYVKKLITDHTPSLKPAAPIAQEPIKIADDLSMINYLFNKVSEHLKSPKIRLAYDGELYTDAKGHLRMRNAKIATLYIPKRTNYPGSIYVQNNVDWYCRISSTGELFPNPKRALPDKLIPMLKAFADNPAKVASEHGKLIGRCCFCNRHLEDERSTEVGYGPICAQHYGLAWGEAIF